MRIIAGEKRGAKLISPADMRIRPTTDRVKEAIFGSIQFYLAGACVLDLFAGSGALGLEAVSRGADNVVLVDADAAAVETIKRNIAAIGNPQNVQIIKDSYEDAIRLFQNSEKFDIVLIDPPYKSGFYCDVAQKLVTYNALRHGEIIIMESDGLLEIDMSGLTFDRSKKYGATYVHYYKYGEQ